MSKFKEVVAEALIPIVKKAGTGELKVALAGIKEHNTIEVYNDILNSLYCNFTLLKQAALNTKTNIDDVIIDLVLDAVKEKAQEEKIIL